MGRSVLLTRTSDGTDEAFDNVCLHRQSQVVTGCGTAKRFACPYHAWTYDNTGKLVGLPGREGFPGITVKSDGLTELPATEVAGFLWVALDPGATLDVAAHLGPLADELDSWGIGRWSPLGKKVLDSPINWKLAIDTFTENYHFATVHATVRDEDYKLVEGLQANLESGARDQLLFGRNEPGLQHRHITWAEALAAFRHS